MKYFITGGCGFIGTNLALSFSKQNCKDILILDNLSKITANKNLSLLKRRNISFAKIDISNLKTFVGDVARVKVFRKSKNAIGDFQFVQESKLESIELLRDIATAADTELSYGEFDSYNLNIFGELVNPGIFNLL